MEVILVAIGLCLMAVMMSR